MSVYVDGDDCPVLDEIYAAIEDREVPVYVVATRYIKTPPSVELVLFEGSREDATAWVVDRADGNDIVVTDDADLAASCTGKGAKAITSGGREFDARRVAGTDTQRALLSRLGQGADAGPRDVSERERRKFSREFARLLDRAGAKSTGGHGEEDWP